MNYLIKSNEMKTVFITYGQAHDEAVIETLEKLEIRGFTRWDGIDGKGSIDGEPRFGTHTWPALNSATMTVIEDDKVDELLAALKMVDQKTPMLGLRAFVWNIEKHI